MAMREPSERLRWAREQAGYGSAADAARALNLDQPTYFAHENGSRGLSRAGRRYADFYRVSLEWLLTGRGDPRPRPASTRQVDDQPGISAPLISWVSAGALKTPDAVIDLDDAERVYAPGLDPKGDWIALRVEGDSMDRISPPESLIFVDRKDRRLVTNACYVIADVEGGEATYKRFRSNPDRWEPVSTNTAHEAMFPAKGHAPVIIGRVKKTVLDM